MSAGTIVVVEDDPTNRLLITQILRKHDYEVFAAADGARGLALIQEVLPDVVVTDLQMPELDGVSMLVSLRQQTKTATIPVLVLTSLAERADVRKGMAAGADDYLTKPFTPVELADAVAAQIRKRQSALSAQKSTLGQALHQALEMQRHNLSGQYERRLKQELAETISNENLPPVQDESFSSATLLCADLLQPSWQMQLSPGDLADALRKAYSHAIDTLSIFGARSVHLLGQQVLAVFTPVNDTRSVDHSMRAIKSAYALLQGANRVMLRLQQDFPAQSFERMQMAIALHSDAVAVASLKTAESAADVRGVPVGAAVRTVQHLQLQALRTRCRVLVSEATAQRLQGTATFGRQIDASNTEWALKLKAFEVLGWHPEKAGRAKPAQA